MKKKFFSFFTSVLLILSSCGVNGISFKENSVIGQPSFSVSSTEESHISSSSNINALEALKIYDVYGDDASPNPFEFLLEEYEDPYFTLDKSLVITNKTYGDIVYRGSALYIYDANNDGYRDFCRVLADGSGVIYWYVSIYDLHNNKECFRHWERLRFSYFLNLKNDGLYVRQVQTYYVDETINEGKLSFDQDKGIYISWNKNYDITDFDVKVTYADPIHTPITIYNNKKGYKVFVDDVSQFFFDIEIRANRDYREDDIPVSFAMPTKNTFAISSVPKVNSLQRYCFFFTENSGAECTTHITVSNITKTFVFSVRSGSSYLTLGDVLPWSKAVSAQNMTKFESEHEMKGTPPLTNFRQITRYYDQSSFSNVLVNFNQIAFEISAEDFGFLNYDYQSCNTYRLYLKEQVYSYQTISTYVKGNGKWYKLRSFLRLGSANDSEHLYGFPSGTEEALIYNYDETITGQSVNYLNDLLFTKNYVQDKKMEDTKYYFVINAVKYCILSPKEFLSSKGNYIHKIVSDKDFSDLFQ